MNNAFGKRNFSWVLAAAVIAAVFLVPVVHFDYQRYIAGFIQAHYYLAPLVVIFFRFIGVVLAPLPGAPVAFASIALLSWQEAWLYNFIGAEAGSICAFFIARKFREPAVAHLAPLKRVHEWQEKISQRKQFVGFIGLRFVSIVAFDFVSYAAGLTQLPFRIFLGASLLVDIPVGLAFFYFGGLALKYSFYLFISFVIIFGGALVVWKYIRPGSPSFQK